MEILFYGLIIGVIFLLFGAVLMFFRSKNPALLRMDAAATSGTPREINLSLNKEKENLRADKFLKPFQDKLRKEQDDKSFSNDKVNVLRSAGYYNPKAGAILYAIRLTLAIILTVGLSTVFLITGTTLKPIVATLLVVALGAAGYFLPLMFVGMKAKERKLQFSEGLPDALDMILICLESGLSFPAALKYVAKDFHGSHPIISEHFDIVNLEFQAGRKRSDALKNLAVRVDLDELHSIVNLVNQSEVLGTSLTRSIRAAAEDMRRDRMLKAEEKANTLPVKMAIPLTVCIFPTLFCIILVPVMITISTSLSG